MYMYILNNFLYTTMRHHNKAIALLNLKIREKILFN